MSQITGRGALDGSLDQLSGKQVACNIVLLITFLGPLLVLPSALGIIPYVALLAYLTRQEAQAPLQVLTIQFVMQHVNPGVFNVPASYGLHLVVPVAVLIRLHSRGDLQWAASEYQFFKNNVLLVAMIGALNIAFSTYAMVSVAKIAFYGVYTCAVMASTISAMRKNHFTTVEWYYSVILVLLVLNIPMYFHGAGKFVNGTGFNGIMNHPQLLGHVLGISAAYLIALMVCSRRLHWPTTILVGWALVSVYTSECRGGLLSCVLAVSVWYGIQVGKLGPVPQRAIRRTMPLFFLLFAFVCFEPETVSRVWSHFVTKSRRSSDNTLLGSFLLSRGSALPAHLDVFQRHPLTGAGFQVSDAPTFRESVVMDPAFQAIPISAPIENGFIYTAVLAEGGVIGAPLLYGLMLIVFLPSLRRFHRPESVLILAVMLSNVTEATFFSPSGLGAWNWQMLALGYFGTVTPLRRGAEARVVRLSESTQGVQRAGAPDPGGVRGPLHCFRSDVGFG